MLSAESTQFIKGEAHHAWLISHMTAVLILQLLVSPSGERGESLLVWGHQAGYQ